MTQPKRATFDCYGTLIDWEGGAASFLYEMARRHEREAPARPRAARSLGGASVRARVATGEATGGALGQPVGAGRRARLALDSGDGDAMARSMESWQPLPDTVKALRAARAAGIRLWIISNTDRAIIEHSLRHMDVEFDGVTVAEDCRAYKPADAPFEAALRAIDLPANQILHVAFGFKYDIGPAQHSGCERPG